MALNLSLILKLKENGPSLGKNVKTRKVGQDKPHHNNDQLLLRVNNLIGRDDFFFTFEITNGEAVFFDF